MSDRQALYESARRDRQMLAVEFGFENFEQMLAFGLANAFRRGPKARWAKPETGVTATEIGPDLGTSAPAKAR